MKYLVLLLLININQLCSAQRGTVDSLLQHEIIETLLLNRQTADFKEIYGNLTFNSKIIKTYGVAVEVKDKNIETFKLDFMKHLKILFPADSSFLIYNLTADGKHQIVGTYVIKGGVFDLQMYPALEYRESFLDEVTKFYSLDSVAIIGIYGAGIGVLAGKEIWIIEKNERTDLKTYVKESYKTLKDYRGYFLLEDGSKWKKHD